MKKPEMIKDDKQRGEWAELRFMARAAEHGVKINKPWGDSSPYDFVVGSDGNLVRVQVKSTCRHHANGYECTIRASKVYAADAFDFLAAYVIPEDVWYIIPEPVMRGLATMYLQPSRPQAKYAKYEEAWQLLREATGVKDTQVQTPEETAPHEEDAWFESSPMHRALTHMSKEMMKVRERHIAAFQAMRPRSEK